jgi:hypothetical protein
LAIPELTTGARDMLVPASLLLAVPWFEEAAPAVKLKPTPSTRSPPPPVSVAGGVLVTDEEEVRINGSNIGAWAQFVDPIDFSAESGRIYANGGPFDIKGINWWGSESRNGPPGGLNKHSLAFYLDLIAFHGFNAVRPPGQTPSPLRSAALSVPCGRSAAAAQIRLLFNHEGVRHEQTSHA